MFSQSTALGCAVSKTLSTNRPKVMSRCHFNRLKLPSSGTNASGKLEWTSVQCSKDCSKSKRSVVSIAAALRYRWHHRRASIRLDRITQSTLWPLTPVFRRLSLLTHSGDRTKVRRVMIPALLDDIVINRVSTDLCEVRSRANTNYSGRGRRDVEKNWFANTSVWDTKSGQLAVRVTGLHYNELDVAPKPDPHRFLQVSWKPDITFLSEDEMIGQDVVKDRHDYRSDCAQETRA